MKLLLLLVDLLGKLPIPLRAALGRTLGHFFGMLPTRERKITALQLKRFLPADVPMPNPASVFANLGETLMESINLSPLIARIDQHVAGPESEFFRSLRSGDRPIVAITAHTSNWDLLAAYTIAKGLLVTTVGRRARSEALQEFLTKLRSAYGVTTVWRDDPSAAKQLVRALTPGSTLAVLIDQDTNVPGVFSPFFGTPAFTSNGVVDLARRRNARIFSAFLERTSPLHYQFTCKELTHLATTDEILLHYHQHLEEVVRRHPEQWVWNHKRWRTRVTGERLSTKEYLRLLDDELRGS